jgi:hypothetical protein
MKTTTLKKAIHITLFCLMLIATVIITKSTVKNIKQLYGFEKANYTAMSCFTDLIY